MIVVPLVCVVGLQVDPNVQVLPSTVVAELVSIAFVTAPFGMLMVPLPVIGPPVNPAPVATLVTVPPELGDALVSVIVPPKATVPPPDIPDPAVTVTELLASMVFVTPAEGMLIVPVVVIGPPVRPAPVATLVTVPPLGVEHVRSLLRNPEQEPDAHKATISAPAAGAIFVAVVNLAIFPATGESEEVTVPPVA